MGERVPRWISHSQAEGAPPSPLATLDGGLPMPSAASSLPANTSWPPSQSYACGQQPQQADETIFLPSSAAALSPAGTSAHLSGGRSPDGLLTSQGSQPPDANRLGVAGSCMQASVALGAQAPQLPQTTQLQQQAAEARQLFMHQEAVQTEVLSGPSAPQWTVDFTFEGASQDQFQSASPHYLPSPEVLAARPLNASAGSSVSLAQGSQRGSFAPTPPITTVAMPAQILQSPVPPVSMFTPGPAPPSEAQSFPASARLGKDAYSGAPTRLDTTKVAAIGGSSATLPVSRRAMPPAPTAPTTMHNDVPDDFVGNVETRAVASMDARSSTLLPPATYAPAASAPPSSAVASPSATASMSPATVVHQHPTTWLPTTVTSPSVAVGNYVEKDIDVQSLRLEHAWLRQLQSQLDQRLGGLERLTASAVPVKEPPPHPRQRTVAAGAGDNKSPLAGQPFETAYITAPLKEGFYVDRSRVAWREAQIQGLSDELTHKHAPAAFRWLAGV